MEITGAVSHTDIWPSRLAQTLPCNMNIDYLHIYTREFESDRWDLSSSECIDKLKSSDGLLSEQILFCLPEPKKMLQSFDVLVAKSCSCQTLYFIKFLAFKFPKDVFDAAVNVFT